MTDNIHEKLAPESFLNKSGNIEISYDLQGSDSAKKGEIYYSVLGDNIPLWLNVNMSNKGVSLKKGTQVIAKAKAKSNAGHLMKYVVVVTGKHKLDQGYIESIYLKTKKDGPLPTIVDQSTAQGKANLEHVGGDYLYTSSTGKKALVLPGSTTKMAGKDLYIVFDTYKDKKGEYYLALREKPQAGKNVKIIAELSDATLVEKLSVSTENPNWWKIKVYSEDSETKSGYANSKWLKKYNASGGKLAAGTLLSYYGKPKKNSKYIKVKVLNNRAAGLVGYVGRQFIKTLPKTSNQGDIVVEIPFREALQKLSDKFGVKYIKTLTGLEWVNLKDPTYIPTLYKSAGLSKFADISPQLYADKNIAFYNKSSDTIDILQPYYFAPSTIGNEILNSLQQKFSEVPWACEPLARAMAIRDTINAVDLSTGNSGEYTPQQQQAMLDAEKYADLKTKLPPIKDIYQDSVTYGVTIENLGKRILDGTFKRSSAVTVVKRMVEDVARHFFKIDAGIFEAWFGSYAAKTTITFAPQIYASPRWGYFTFKIPVAELEKSQLNGAAGILTAEASNFLTDLTQGTTVGAVEAHGFLAKIPRLKENTAQISTSVATVESRLSDLATDATIHHNKLESANKTLWRVGTNGQQQQRPLSQQATTLRSFPAFLKASLVNGPLTPKNVESLDIMAVRIDIKKGADKSTESEQVKNDLLGLSSIVLENTFLRESTASRAPTLETVNEKKENETIVLSHGKLVALEKRFADEIDKTLGQINFYEFDKEVKNIEDVLKAQPTDTLPRAPDEYVFKKKGLHGYLVYMLADIVRSGTQARRFDFDEKIPENLQRNILDQGKVKNIENYGSLISYDVGLIKPTPKTSKMVFYTPDFPYLLKQIRWLNFTENLEEKTLTANINYDFLQIKLFMVDTNQILKDYGPPEYSFIMALGTKTFNLLNSIQNEKDFFDQLYTYQVFYKPPTEAPKPKTEPPAPDPKAKVAEPLSDSEKQKLMEALFARRNKMVEQAFGGSGCVEFALKSVRSLEDLYSNVMNKANWSLFLAQVIDRFKCELSKLGGGSLACLADFDVMGTYQSGLDAVETIENFPDFLKKEIQKQPTAPIMNLIYDRKIPKMPAIDWYACLRSFLLALVLKIVTELIIGFVQAILAALDVQCDADFSSCEKSDRDADSADLDPTPATTRASFVAAGVNPQTSATASRDINIFLRNAQIDSQITPAKIQEFLHFLGENMSVSHFKSLLQPDTPVHIFSHGKLLTNNFFAPIKFGDEQLRTVLSILNSQYSYDALIAAMLLEQTLPPDPNCPPNKYNDGSNIVSAIKDALKAKIQAETGVDDAAADKAADDALKKSLAATEEKISAFCEILNFAGGALNEINSAPSMLAAVANDAIAGSISNLVSQLRIKPFYDYSMLRYLFTGDAFGNNPTKDDLVRAEMSLAYNVLYRNYWLTKVDHRSYYKNFELRPEGFRKSLAKRWDHTTSVLKADSFEKEFVQDLLKVVVAVQPFLLPFYPAMEQAIFKAKEPLNGFDITLLGASRDLNNSNYFYAWAENLISLIPIVDPRRFGTKYPDFVKENYPNAADNKLIEPAFILETVFDQDGLRYKYSNGNIVLMDLQIGLKEFSVTINEERTKFSRSLPKLSEPFFVDETQDYLNIIDTHNKINTATNTVNPQKRIYNSLVEQGLEQNGLYSGTGEEGTMREMIIKTFNNSYGRINKELNENLENADEKVAEFFFKPFMEANKIYGEMNEKEAEDKADKLKKDIINKLTALGNPRAPAALFFQRSDNLFSEIFFEDSVSVEVTMLMEKVKAALKNFYGGMSDGQPYDPKAIAKALEQGEPAPEAFYEVEKLAFSKANDWLSRSQAGWGEHIQEKMLEAVKEVSP